MAIIKYGNFVVDSRGSINGNTYSKNKYGAFVRAKITPVNPATGSQVSVRNSFAATSQAWRGLTQAQRDAWNLVAPNFTRANIFGDNAPLSGFNLFMRLNLNLDAVNQAQISVPPAQVDVPGIQLVLLHIDNSSQLFEISADTTPVPAGYSVIIRATAALSPGKKFVSTEFRQIAVIPAGGTFPATLSSSYIAVFGSIAGVGQKVFAQSLVVSNSTGIPGIASQFDTLIVA